MIRENNRSANAQLQSKQIAVAVLRSVERSRFLRTAPDGGETVMEPKQNCVNESDFLPTKFIMHRRFPLPVCSI